MAKPKPGGLLESVQTIVYAGLIAIGIRTLAFEPFNIPSASMEPTLLVGDYLFVSKYSYGYSRYSLPLSPDLFNGRLFGRYPDRGDVVVFKFPRDNETDYIKRVIGLPGDRIQMTNGQLYINGTAEEARWQIPCCRREPPREPRRPVGRNPAQQPHPRNTHHDERGLRQ